MVMHRRDRERRSPLQMVDGGRARCRGILGADGSKQVLSAAAAFSHALRSQPAGCARERAARAQLLQNRAQLGIPSLDEKQVIESRLCCLQRREVAGPLCSLDGRKMRPRGRHHLRRDAAGAERKGVAFKSLPDGVDVARLFRGEGRDHRPLVRGNAHEALAFELAEALPYRAAAYVECFAQFALGQATARLELAVCNRGAEIIGDLLAQWVRNGQRDDGAIHGQYIPAERAALKAD